MTTMTPTKKSPWLLIVVGAAAAAVVAIAIVSLSGGPEPHRPPEQRSSDETRLTPQQRAAAGIVVQPIHLRPLARVFRAPGEVKSNDYTTHLVASRIGATVIARHAKLGDRVRRGQVLVTLFSADMAGAQSEYFIAHRDHARLAQLGPRAIAAMQIEQAGARAQGARGRLESFGLAPDEIAAIARRGLPVGRTGQFELTAARDGKITLDDFRAGQVVEPGKTLYEISDPAIVWVEAQVSPNHAADIGGERARVIDRTHVHDARIVQVGDRIDEATRTIPVRLQLSNPTEELKPGEFVDVELYGTSSNVLAVPTAAVIIHADGDRVVYVETPTGFKAHPVRTLYAVGDLTAISGIASGSRVVTAGAFFIASEAAKSGFEEGHAH